MASKNQELEELVFKYLIVGDTGVGKSSILIKYTEERFEKEHNVTVGVDFRSRTIKHEDKALIKLQIWDTAGQETFGSIVRSFYRDAAAIFLVYSVKSRDSFNGALTWIEEVKANCDSDPIFVLIGNQADNDEGREVTYEEGVKFMNDNDLSFFFETSAYTGQNIEMVFTEVTTLAYLKYEKEKKGARAKGSINLRESRPGTRLTATKAREQKKPLSGGGCC